MTEKLLPCPFCGGRAELRWSGGSRFAECTQCGVSTSDGNGTAEDGDIDSASAALWNRRAALAQAEPGKDEPVAWMRPDGEHGFIHAETKVRQASLSAAYTIPLYTRPSHEIPAMPDGLKEAVRRIRSCKMEGEAALCLAVFVRERIERELAEGKKA